MRVKKLAGGGLPAFVSFTNVEQPLPQFGGSSIFNASTESTTKESKEGDELVDKEMRKFLLEHGLPSDVQYFIENSEIFHNMLSTSNPRAKNRMYNQLLSILPEIRQNKQEYDDAVKHAREKGTLQEFAVTSDGSVYVADSDGNVTLRDPAHLQEGDRMVTIGYMAQMRAYYTGKAFDKGQFTNVIASSIGIKDVVKTINDLASNVGKYTTSTEYFAKKDGQLSKVKEGLSKILEESEPGVYKVSEKKITHDGTINMAINYILAQLNPQEMGVLKAHATNIGLTDKDGIKQFVTLALRSQLDETSEINVDYQHDLSSEAGLTKGKKSGDIDMNDVDTTPASRFFAGMGELQPYSFRIADGTNAFVAYGNSTYVSKNGGTPMGKHLLLSELSLSDLNGGIDLTQISFGGIPIQSTDTNKILIDGDKVVSVELPYTEVNGRIIPDVDHMNTISKILQNNKQLIKEGKFQEVNKIFAQHGLKPYFTENGTSTGFYKRFAVMQAYADEQLVDNGRANYHLFGEYSDVSDYELGEIVAELKAKNKKEGIKYSPSRPTVFGITVPFTSENVVKSMIFIPITSNSTSWFQGKMKAGEAQQIETASQVRQAKLNAVSSYKPTKNIF